MHLTINEVGTPHIILILAIPSRITRPTIIPHQFVAVCCDICRLLFHEISPNSCHIIRIFILYLLDSDDSRQYPI